DKDTDAVMIVVPKENTTYKLIYDSILSDTTPKCIKYSDENGKTKSLDVKSDAYYMYNGRPMPFPTAEMLNPKPGEVVAIDNDDDGKIDVVIIWEYTSYVSKQVTSERVTLKERKFALEEDGKTDIYSIMFDNNDFDVNFINETAYMDAEQLNKTLKADMVLSICESDDQSLMTVFVSEKKVTGKVSVVSEDTLVIGETEVSFFEDIDFKKHIGKSLTVYLDKNGYAVAYEETEAEKYAVLHSIAKTEGISPDTMIKLFLDDNSFKTFTVGYDKKIEFSVNGGTTTSRVAGKDLYDITLNGAEELEKQLIKYSLDETGTNIKSIYLAENASNTFEVAEGKYEVNEGEVNEDEFRMNLDFKGGTVKTGYSKLRVTDYSNLSNINNRTFYEVSQPNTLLVFISDDEKNCSYTTFNDYNGGVDGIIADFKAYDKQEVGWYKVILCNADAAVEGKISLGDPCMFITGVKYVFDKENDSEGKVFTGVVSTLNNFKDVTIKVPEDDLTNIAANNYL
ncbi:MAG: hypothetical protein Q4F84_11255, partial [Fibrobacter sp.]|nr:hypothetical protein [Fibrobacter sp.]